MQRCLDIFSSMYFLLVSKEVLTLNLSRNICNSCKVKIPKMMCILMARLIKGRKYPMALMIVFLTMVGRCL